MSELTNDKEYRDWIVSIKSRVQASQIKAAVAVNVAMLELYWFIGDQIVDRQENASWGSGFLKQMSQDLLIEFPDMKGFSVRNLQRIRRWYQFWSDAVEMVKQPVALIPPQAVANSLSNAPQLVAQIPWGHNGLILEKLSDPADALFYVQKTIESGRWGAGSPRRHGEHGVLQC